MANVRKRREELGVKAGDQLVIKGIVTFAKLDKLVEGEALIKENERRAKIGMIESKPFRSVSIENPEIVQGQGTPLETFYGQEVYTAKGTGAPTMTVESKSLFPPKFGHIQNGVIVEIEDPMKNPEKGQEVYLMIEAYSVKGYANLGSTFNSIVYGEGPIEFYEGANSLAGFGEALGMPVKALDTTPTPVVPAEEPAPAPATAPAPAFGQTAPATPATPATPAPASNAFGVQDNAVEETAPTANPFGGANNSPFA